MLRSPIVLDAFMRAVTHEDRWSKRWLAKESSPNKVDPGTALCMALGAVGSGPLGPDIMSMIA